MKKQFLKPQTRYSQLALPAVLLMSSYSWGAIEEVVVTANKRVETANEIGLSIDVLSGQKLAEQKLTSLEEITSSVPGLVFATSEQNTPILTLRGVGFNESSLGVYPATSLYSDEVPLPFPVMAAHSAYDLERVEVLKGPQGVLFGQNSTGGAVNFIAANPTEEFNYGGDVSYGRFNKIETNAYLSGPLSEQLAGRLAVQNVHADEWQESVSRNANNGKEDYTAVRFLLRYQPNDAAAINLNVNGWKDQSDPQALQLVAATPKAYNAAPSQALKQIAEIFPSDEPRQANWTGDLSGDKEFMQASLRTDIDLTDTTKLTALIAYSDYEQDQLQDADGQALETAGYTNEGNIESTFGEVRLAGDQAAGLRWLIGANYEDSSTYEEQVQLFRDNTSSRAGTLFMNRVGLTLDQEIESYAVFSNIDYDLSDAITLKFGARYTETEIDARICDYAAKDAPGTPDSSTFGSNVGALFNILGGRSGNSFTPIGLHGCFTLNENGVPGFAFIDTLKEDNVSWRAGLDYRLDDDTLVYFNLSQGYKAGSYPVISASTYAQLDPVTEESVLAYELGFKKSLLAKRIQWNGAVFYYEYDDKQVRGKIDAPPFGPLDKLVNVPESTIVGAETSLVAQLSDALTLSAALTYVNSEVQEYTGYTVFGQIADFSGESLPYTPEFSYDISLDYRKTLANGELFAGMNLRGQTESEAIFNGDDTTLDPVAVAAGFHTSPETHPYVIDEYTVVGAQIGYQSDDNWRVMLWGKNITDEYYFNSVATTSDSAARLAARPRTYGITFGYRY